MRFEYSKEIPLTVDVHAKGVKFIADCEIVALVDYGTFEGEIEWKITGLRKHENPNVVIDSTDALFNLLRAEINDAQIESVIGEQYTYSSRDTESGYWTGARMMT
jgi:hypothetical protein